MIFQRIVISLLNPTTKREFSPFCSPMDDGKYLSVLMILSGERSFLSSICSH